MNNYKFTLIILFSFGCIQGQEKLLSLHEAIAIGTTKSNQAILADTKVKTSEWELKTVKNNQLPSVSLSGQFFKLTQANVKGDLIPNSGSGIDINQLAIGQANATIPVFNGFKIQNSIKASKNLNQAEVKNAAHTKEQIALYVTQLYFGLYKTQQMIELTEDYLKSAKQRVSDFQALEDNGLLAHNDLLKSKLQESDIELTLATAKKNNSVLNFQLVNFLQLEEGTKITISNDEFGSFESISDNSIQRNDLEALSFQEEAAKNNIKIAQGNYYPTFNLMGGYIALDVKNALTVTNAMNFGAGVSYDVTSIFKNKKNVEKAKSQALETETRTAVLTDKIKEEVQEATENYLLAIKQKEVYEKAQEQASENYRIVKDKYDNGLSNTNDLLEANVDQLQAKINYTISTSDILQKYYELQFQKGKLTQSIK